MFRFLYPESIRNRFFIFAVVIGSSITSRADDAERPMSELPVKIKWTTEVVGDKLKTTCEWANSVPCRLKMAVTCMSPSPKIFVVPLGGFQADPAASLTHSWGLFDLLMEAGAVKSNSQFLFLQLYAKRPGNGATYYLLETRMIDVSNKVKLLQGQ